MAPYHFSVTVDDDFDSAVARTRQALADHGFGIVSEIDVAATIEAKLGVAHSPYLILGACNPQFARDAIGSEPSVGVLLPCNVVVRENGGEGVVVDFMDPAVMVDLVGEKQVHEIADEVRRQLEMTRDTIATTRAAV